MIYSDGRTENKIKMSEMSRKIAWTTFIGSCDVLQHIIPVHETKTASRLRLAQSKQIHFLDEHMGSFKTGDKSDIGKSSISKGLAANEKDIVGSDVFGFKNSKALTLISKPDCGDDQTPGEDDLSDNSTVIMSDNSTADDDQTARHNNKRKSQTRRNLKSMNSKANKVKARNSMTDAMQPYFEGQCSSRTSDHTLSRLNTSRMEYTDMIAALRDVTFICASEQEVMYADYKNLYDSWLFQICDHSFNLLLHGIGSKHRVIDSFIDTVLTDYTCIVVNGYFPSLTVKTILSAITDDILKHTGCFQNPVEQCDFIRQHFESNDYLDLFIIIHNIDGMSLRSHKVQLILSLLACIPGIHIVASVDHINAHLLWDQTMMSRFNWLVYDVTTFEHYTDETSYENSLLVQQAGSLQLSSLVHVMHSLTQNARGIFLILARHQLDNRDNLAYIGLSFTDLYQKCREAFLVNSDLTLQTQLTEFRDHKLLRVKKAADGMEYLRIGLESSTLAEFIEQYEQNI